jgi:hypothetical protein
MCITKTPFDQLRIYITSRFKKPVSDDTFLTRKPKLTKIEAGQRTSFNETFIHIYKEVKQ